MCYLLTLQLLPVYIGHKFNRQLITFISKQFHPVSTLSPMFSKCVTYSSTLVSLKVECIQGKANPLHRYFHGHCSSKLNGVVPSMQLVTFATMTYSAAQCSAHPFRLHPASSSQVTCWTDYSLFPHTVWHVSLIPSNHQLYQIPLTRFSNIYPIPFILIM